MALQHLRSSTADKRPTPGAMSDGQLALNTNLASPGLFFKDSNGDSVKIGPVHVGTTAPNVTPGAGGQAGNSKGEAWLDTTAANPILKVWNGSAFVAVQPVGTGTVVSTTDTGTVTSTMILDGTILNADINASAGIVDTKLATIATAGKVSNSATTAASANTANAIVARDASGDFAAGDITISDKIIHDGDTNTAIRFPAADVVTVETGGSERARIDSSGRLLLGTSTAAETVSISSASSTPSFQNAATGQAGSSAGLFNWSTASSAAYLNFSKSKSGTIGTRGQVADGNDLGSVLFVGDDGTNFVSSAGIVAQVDGTPGTDNMPGRLVFRTKADGATGTPAEAMRITSAGNVGIGTTTPGANLQIGDGSSATVGSTAPYAWVSARALSQSNADTTPQELLRLSWQEGTQDLGVGEGCAINFAASLLVDSGTFYPVASIASFKETTSDSNRSSALTFSTSADGTAAPTERLRIDSSGRLVVGTSTAYFAAGSAITAPLIQTHGTNANLAQLLIGSWASGNNVGGSITLARSESGTIGDFGSALSSTEDALGNVRFNGSDGTKFVEGANISAFVDGTWGTNDAPTRLVFSTTADGASSPTEQMRIDNAGNVGIGTTSPLSPLHVAGLTRLNATETAVTNTSSAIARTAAANNTGDVSLESVANSTSTRHHISFVNPNGIVGSVSTNASATTYNTSSDYRLKENVVLLTGAIDRLQQIPVHRFNFIADPDTVVDGFIAHEAQEIVPECVTGTKDEVDENGNPAYQGIDQSKLVPLLTAALQEAVAKIESLEARLTAAGI
jgi:hypothetical protein